MDDIWGREGGGDVLEDVDLENLYYILIYFQFHPLFFILLLSGMVFEFLSGITSPPIFTPNPLRRRYW
jgi:hypothetical protein